MICKGDNGSLMAMLLAKDYETFVSINTGNCGRSGGKDGCKRSINVWTEIEDSA